MLVNKTTLNRIWEHEFRSLFPEISFPSTLTSEMLTDFDYAVLIYPEQPIVSVGSKVIDTGVSIVDGEYHVSLEVVPETQEELDSRILEIQQTIVSQVQDRLDTFAKTRNYDGILSAASYVNSSIPQFATEGAYAIQARDLIWSTLYTILAEVQAGTRLMPVSIASIEADLPVLTWPI